MNDYIEVRIDLTPCSEDMTDVMAALLADRGYESFVPDSRGLTAYVPCRMYDKDALAAAVRALPFEARAEWHDKFVEGRDWNHEWERNYFKPITVDDVCVIHSTFHRDIPKCRYDITIDPKMAFGTGHHATTTLILRRLLGMDLTDKSVIDMGTGTGILAILAAMRGARPVVGIEIDEAAYVNAKDNVALNSHPEIRLINSDASALTGLRLKADLFLANINRNVITGDMAVYAGALEPGGKMILSGFYMADVEIVTAEAGKYGLEMVDVSELDNWASVLLTNTNAV